MSTVLEFDHVFGKRKSNRRKADCFPLQDISFQLEKGYILGITGKNGAGKTTLFRYLMDASLQYEGRILYEGKEIRENREWFLNEVGFISEEQQFFKNATIADQEELSGCFYSRWDAKEYRTRLKEFGLSLGRRLHSLSRGEYMKFQLAFALAHDSRLYLIDEATAGMDPIFRTEFFQILRNIMESGERTIVMITHNQEELSCQADYIAVLKEGKLSSYREAW